MEKIKLIWDFRGSNDIQTATHYTKHLIEFFEEKKLTLIDYGVETISEFHHLAYAVVNKHDIENIKHSLKPQRAFLLNN